MSSLYAKLKILVAKLYKAEKLYASMRRPPLASRHDNNHSGASRLPASSRKISTLSGSDPKDSAKDSSFASGLLIEHANEIRSLEWFEVHHSFRVQLNDILSRGNTQNLGIELNNLWHEFCSEFSLAEEYLNESRSLAYDSMEKEEFAHLLKLSSDLIKRKARLQALKVIHDELEVLIHHDRKHKSSLDMFPAVASHDSQIHDTTEPEKDPETPPSIPSNVIPLRRRVV
jgi:hypothetical protein